MRGQAICRFFKQMSKVRSFSKNVSKVGFETPISCSMRTWGRLLGKIKKIFYVIFYYLNYLLLFILNIHNIFWFSIIFSNQHYDCYKIISYFDMSQTQKVIIVLLAVFTIASAQTDCKDTHLEYFSEYALGRQD